MKRKKSIKQIILSIVTSVFLATVISQPLYALSYSDLESGTNGSFSSMLQKLYYWTMMDCVEDKGNYQDGFGYWNEVSNEDAKNGTFFLPGIWSWNHSPYLTYSAIIELETAGYDDGKIYCGENSGQMVKNAIKYWGLSSIYDIICDYNDGYKSGGIFWVDTSKVTCKDNTGDYTIDTSRAKDYITRLVTKRVFNNKIPGGSLDFTDLERYYLYSTIFYNVCKVGEPQYNNRELSYQVMEWDNKKFVQAGYSQKDDPDADDDVYTWTQGGEHYYHTCQEITERMMPGSAYFSAFAKSKQKAEVDSCINSYDSKLREAMETSAKYFSVHTVAAYNFLVNAELMLDLATGTGSWSESGPGSGIIHVLAPSGTLATDYYLDAMRTQIDDINKGIPGKNGSFVPLYNAELIANVMAAAEDLASKTVVDADENVTARPDAATIANATAVIQEMRQAYDKVQTDYIDPYEQWLLSKQTANTRESGDVWKLDSLTDEVQCVGSTTFINGMPDVPVPPDVDNSYTSDVVDTNPMGSESTSIELTCMNSGGAESLGWIVCPVLDLMTRASGQLYNNYIVPALQVKPKLFEERTGDSNDTFDVWGIFQGFANVLFIILLLAVIFSQLTGVGIDNYGIKKILPKLLVAAILVNLSYYICVALVDVSNIVGNSLQAMFDGMASGLSAPLPGGGGSGAGATAITAVLILGGLAAVGVAIWQNPAILLTLLVAALGVVISILFLFVILSAREAAIVVLTVISPLAFACYMLPNTKKLFDKWLKIWEGLLLVYPICGLLVGGGNFMSKLMLSATGAGTDGSGFFGSFTAMLIGIVPIFFIPTVLKGSFAAMGNLGAKISGFGDRMRGGVTRGIRNSEGFRNAQKLGLERRTRKKAGLDKNGNLTKSGERRANLAQTRFGRLIGADKRRAAYINAAKKDVATGEEANASLTNALSRSAIAANGGNAEAYYTDQFEQAANSGNIRGMNAALAAAVSSGYLKDKDIAKIVRNAQNAGKINIKDAATRAAWMRDAATKYGNGFLATDFEMRHWMQNGGSNTLGDFGAYAASAKANGDPMIGVDDIKPEDIPRLSGDSLAGLAQAGILTASMAQQVMAKNPNISADKRIMLGAIASGAANDASIVAASMAAGNIGASVLKEEAKALMLNPSATTWTDKNSATHPIRAIRITDDTAAQVNSWTAPTPVAANVVQDFSSGYSGQIEPVDVQIRGATNTAGVVAPAAPSSTAPSSTGSSSGIILDSSGEQARQAMREFDARERARGNRNWPGNSNS